MSVLWQKKNTTLYVVSYSIASHSGRFYDIFPLTTDTFHILVDWFLKVIEKKWYKPFQGPCWAREVAAGDEHWSKLEGKIKRKELRGLSVFMEGLYFWDPREEYSHILYFWKILLTVKTAQTGLTMPKKFQECYQGFYVTSFSFIYSFASLYSYRVSQATVPLVLCLLSVGAD